MNSIDIDNQFNINDLLDIKIISNETNFWLIRTREGFFYDEYIENRFIALGWNILDSVKLKELDDDDKIKLFKEEINQKYKTKQGSTIFNKCDRFINEMKKGDIVMIPSCHNKFLTFAIIDNYFEENETTYAKELEVDKRIKDGIDYGTIVKCPYKKRRKINIIKTVEGNRLNPNLYRVLASYHGISMISKYANFVLSSIYNFYIWDNKLNFVINIEEENGINAKYFSELIYYISDILMIESDEVNVYTQANVNSPGDLITTLVTKTGDFAQYLKDNWLYILVIWGAISGVKIGPITLSSIPEIIMKVHTHIRDGKKIKIENDNKLLDSECKKIDIENKKIELESNKLDLENKKIDLDERKLNRLMEAKEKINEATSKLKVDRNARSNQLLLLLC